MKNVYTLTVSYTAVAVVSQVTTTDRLHDPNAGLRSSLAGSRSIAGISLLGAEILRPTLFIALAGPRGCLGALALIVQLHTGLEPTAIVVVSLPIAATHRLEFSTALPRNSDTLSHAVGHLTVPLWVFTEIVLSGTLPADEATTLTVRGGVFTGPRVTQLSPGHQPFTIVAVGCAIATTNRQPLIIASLGNRPAHTHTISDATLPLRLIAIIVPILTHETGNPATAFIAGRAASVYQRRACIRCHNTAILAGRRALVASSHIRR